MSHLERKRDYCLYENKGADQLCSNCTADQCLCFLNSNTCSTILLLLKSEISSFEQAFFCDCTDWFVSNLVRDPEDQFSHVRAYMFSKPENSVKNKYSKRVTLKAVVIHRVTNEHHLCWPSLYRVKKQSSKYQAPLQAERKIPNPAL